MSGAFDERAILMIDEIPSGEFRDVFFKWTPEGVEEPHNCVQVELRRLVNDTNPNDNNAQQNLTVVSNDRASPYQPATFNFQISHDLDQNRLFYFHEEGVPSTWSKDFSEGKRLVQPGEKCVGALTVQPPEDAQVCTNHEIRVTAWTPRGDTIIPVGGTTVNTELRNRTELTLDVTTEVCKDLDYKTTSNAVAPYTQHDSKKPLPPKPPQQCATIQTAGCTSPIRANETIVVRYKDPAGNPVYVLLEQNQMFVSIEVKNLSLINSVGLIN